MGPSRLSVGPTRLPHSLLPPIPLLSALALLFTLLGGAQGGPTLCLAPVAVTIPSGGGTGTGTLPYGSLGASFSHMVQYPNSSKVLLSAQDGLIYSATLPTPGQPGTAALSPLSLFLNLTDRVASGAGLGVLGMAFHPDFLQTGRFFVSYVCDPSKWGTCNSTTHSPGGPAPYCALCRNSSSPKGTCMVPSAESATDCPLVLVVDEFYIPTSNGPVENTVVSRPLAVGVAAQSSLGGGILFQPGTSYLLIALGDQGFSKAPFLAAQRQGSPLGKMLRVDVNAFPPTIASIVRQGLLGEYGTPPGNLGTRGVPGATFALGLSNPRGCSPAPAGSGQLLCADMRQNQSNALVAPEAGGNCGWPKCSSWPQQGVPSVCQGEPLAAFPVPETGTTPVYGGGFFVTGTPDACLNGWYLFSSGLGTFSAVQQSSSSATLMFPGPIETPSISCFNSTSGTSCRPPFSFISWMQSAEGLPYVLGDTGIYAMQDPASCGTPCGAATNPGPLSSGTPSPNPLPGPQGNTRPSNSSAAPGSSSPAPGSSSPAPGSSSPTPGTAAPSSGGSISADSQGDPSSFLGSSGINGPFTADYWIKLVCIFAVLTTCFCGPYCYFIISGWQQGKKKDERFLQLKQAENELDERLRDPNEVLVYRPPEEAVDDETTTLLTDEDEERGRPLHDEYSDSLSQYSSRQGRGEESVARSDSFVGQRRPLGDGASDAGTDYTGHTGYTGYSRQTSRTGYTDNTARTRETGHTAATGYTGYTGYN